MWAWLRFALSAVAVTTLLVLVGIPITRKLAGDTAVPALLLACAVSLAAALVGAVIILRSRDLGGPKGVFAAMAAMGARLVIVALAGLLIALSGWVALKPFLLWLALSYMALLIVDTRLILVQGDPSSPSK